MIAYISYNTFPGWHARGAIREMLWYHTEHLSDPAEKIRQGRGVGWRFLAKTIPGNESGYSTLICQELLLLLRDAGYVSAARASGVEYNAWSRCISTSSRGGVMESGAAKYLGRARSSLREWWRKPIWGGGGEDAAGDFSPDLLQP